MDVIYQHMSCNSSRAFASLPRPSVAAVAQTQRTKHASGRSAGTAPIIRRIRCTPSHLTHAGDAWVYDSSDEDANDQNEEQILQEYLQKVYAKRANHHAPSPVIRCLNCTQPAPFNGVCQHCGHAHANDHQLTYVPLEYSRSAYVHMRQQQVLQRQQANGTSGSQNEISSSSADASMQDDRATASGTDVDGVVPHASTSSSRKGSHELKFDGSYVEAAAAAAFAESNGVRATSGAASSLDPTFMSTSTNGVHQSTSNLARGSDSANGTTSSTDVTVSSTNLTSESKTASQVDGVHAAARLLDGPVLLAWDDRTSQHQNSNNKPGKDEVTGLEFRTQLHPERPQRTQAIVSRLYRSGLLDCCHAVPARTITEDELLLVHTPELVNGVRDLSRAAAEYDENSPDHTLDVGGDTYANRHTWEVCTMAAGMAVDVATRVAKGEGSHGAAIVRPPGHHAEHNGVMGFCFLNHAALAARAVQKATGVERVAIVDWDVHHGNGAQHILWDDPSILTVSLHRYDNGNYFPGSGHVGEVGEGEGEGHVVNIPWSMPGMGDLEYLAAFDQVLVPVLREFSPQLIIVAAGFDSAALDPLGGCSLTPVGFAQMTHRLKAVGPVVLLLEGGYNLTATAACFEACLKVLLGEAPPPLPTSDAPAFVALRLLSEVLDVHSQYWHSLKPRSTSQLMECYQWLGASSILHQILQAKRQPTTKPPAAAMV